MFIHITNVSIIQADIVMTGMNTKVHHHHTVLMTEILWNFLQTILTAATQAAFASPAFIPEARQAADLAAENNRRIYGYLQRYT
jgi:hypothetical protein